MKKKITFKQIISAIIAALTALISPVAYDYYTAPDQPEAYAAQADPILKIDADLSDIALAKSDTFYDVAIPAQAGADTPETTTRYLYYLELYWKTQDTATPNTDRLFERRYVLLETYPTLPILQKRLVPPWDGYTLERIAFRELKQKIEVEKPDLVIEGDEPRTENQ